MLFWINQVTSKGKALGTRFIPNTSGHHQGPLATLKDTRGHLERVSSHGYLWDHLCRSAVTIPQATATRESPEISSRF